MFFHSTPLTPPTAEDDRLSWLRLIRSRRVGPTTFWRLLAEYGSADAALEALPEIARAAGVESYQPCPPQIVERELRAGRKLGARLVCRGEPDYPEPLAGLDDAPPVLWVRGCIDTFTRPMIALVGSRAASSLGLRMARKLGRDLAEAGFCVVSGLARGIDAAAHQAALEGGTIAVMPGGVDVIYPPEHETLARSIVENGALVSEHPPGEQPTARHFPARNRIVAGLCRAVIVVEAAPGSGSLITARQALDQGREVMAVPGHPLDPRAAGCNMLIRDGATLVRGIQDVLEALSIPAEPSMPAQDKDHRGTCAGSHPAPTPPLPRAHQGPAAAHRSDEQTQEDAMAGAQTLSARILAQLGPSPIAEDQLIRDLDLPAARLASELTVLELEGRILRHPGGAVSLAL
ncbi:DNA processing protein [Albidovulum inexpectatum]|uniref:DNA processing protein n=1 Tax=Albidovulum inexpectatum TaxID=196587 RepID=A0A2S5JEU2_9RHOB|nr:DNA-processing protein DprA [Albidovulum inexpectatum]PPB79845.1 DNA processing protein [Albidovulum inexpectatum]